MPRTGGYNERLFAPGTFRAWYHGTRFRWVAEQIALLPGPVERLVEIGCFDGKLLDALAVRPRRYVGYDANWEGGLDLARRKWEGTPGVEFRLCRAPSDIDASETFDVAVCMDTFEHIPPNDQEGYLEVLARITRRVLLATVPNEKGPVFFLKRAVKALRGEQGREPYTASEFVDAVLGRLDRIPRHEHKGFDYAALVRSLGSRFGPVRARGLPVSFLPPLLSLNVGIRAERPEAGFSGG